jgi:hypothetical protein
MPYYKFGPDDVFNNQIKAHPPEEFWFYNKKLYYNSQLAITGAHVDNVPNAAVGELSLYEMNVDRPTGQLIYPFITKDGSLEAFSTVSTSDFNTDFVYGDIMSGTYPLTSSIFRELYIAGGYATHLSALKTTFTQYMPLSPHYQVSSSLLGRDLDNIALNIITIPSIFYGSSIKKGTVDLKIYYTGTLMAHARDINYDGALVDIFSEVSGAAASPASGSTVGVVLYNEGFIFLTSSVPLGNSTTLDNYSNSNQRPQWLFFGDYGEEGAVTNYETPSSAFSLEFSGTTYTPVVTMFANAPKNAVNYSPNLTTLDYAHALASGSITGSSTYIEPSIPLANVASSSFLAASASFEKMVYISSICIYDGARNKIGVAKLAKPIRKTNEDDYTFKLKLDI